MPNSSGIQPAGPILDGLGVTLELDEGDLVSDAVVIVKVVGEDGSVGILIGASDTTSWVDQLGIMAAGDQTIKAAVAGGE